MDCIIFDKDGTLIKLDGFWGRRTQYCVETKAASLNLGSNFKTEHYDLLGYSVTQNHVRFESPLAIAPMETLYSLAEGIICKYGGLWRKARRIAEKCAQTTLLEDFLLDEIYSKGELVQSLQDLR